MVTIKDLLTPYNDNLLEPIMILSELLNVDKSYIYTYIDRPLASDLVAKFNELMEDLSQGRPIQYILNKKEFLGLDFFLEEGVLIPRNDTEVLADFLIKELGSRSLNVLEIGVGSGALSLSLAYYCKNANITGVDISDQALKVSNINKERLKLKNVNFFKSNLFSSIKGKFNIIFSNPPYIPSKDILKLDNKVKDFEPSLALDGGIDGLDFYRKIISGSKSFLENKGLLAFEVGYNQSKSVIELLKEENFKNISTIKDLAGYERVVYGYK